MSARRAAQQTADLSVGQCLGRADAEGSFMRVLRNVLMTEIDEEQKDEFVEFALCPAL